MASKLYIIDLKLRPAGADEPTRNEQIRLTIGSGTRPSWRRVLRALAIDPAHAVSGSVEIRIEEQGPDFALVPMRDGWRDVEL